MKEGVVCVGGGYIGGILFFVGSHFLHDSILDTWGLEIRPFSKIFSKRRVQLIDF